MSVTASAPQAAVSSHHGEAAEPAPVSNRGAFGSRQVSQSTGGAGLHSVHDTLPGRTRADPRGAVRSNRSRQVTANVATTPGPEAFSALRPCPDDERSPSHSQGMVWDDSVRRIGTVLPAGPSEPVLVNSRIVPGAALGACFEEPYPTRESTGPECLAWYRHVPDLAQTLLTDDGGQTLFAGVRHGFTIARPLDNEVLVRIPDGELGALARRSICFGSNEGSDDRLALATHVENIVRKLKYDTQYGTIYACVLARFASRHMALETVAAALVADPDKLKRGLDGESVHLDLFCISIVTREDYPLWRRQVDALFPLRWRPVCPVPVCRPNGTVCRVAINLNIRHFVVPAEPLGNLSEDSRLRIGAFVTLLGDLDSLEPQGHIGLTVKDMKIRAEHLRHEMAALGWLHFRTPRVAVSEGRAASDLRGRLCRLNGQLERLERNARTLREAGRQLKAMLVERDRRPAGTGRPMHVAARLALAAHLMGGTPMLSCATGRDFTETLDPEIKFLATVAASGNGQLPPVDRDPEVWGSARNNFWPQ